MTCHENLNLICDVFEVRHSVELCPGLVGFSSVGSDLGNSGLYSVMNCPSLQHLHLANTDLLRLDFDEGLSPVLSVCGHNLATLILDRFKHLDINTIGTNCPKLRQDSSTFKKTAGISHKNTERGSQL